MAVFYENDDQRKVAEAYIKQLTDAKVFDDPIVTKVEKLQAFYPAETYHQDYVRHHPNQGYILGVALPKVEKAKKYVELGRKWAQGHTNRMIKVPATAAGIDALEDLAAAGVTINVTLMFTERQYRLARDAIWRGAQRCAGGLIDFKSVYSIFISRIDVYTGKHLPALTAAQGQVGIAIAKHVWRENQEFWKDKALRLRQEIVFASTGVKDPAEPPDKYVAALAGSDIQTNPPATNEAVQRLNVAYNPGVAQAPPQAVLREVEQAVDRNEMERVLIAEGTRKFADPQKQLLALIAGKRKEMGSTSRE